MWTEDEVQKYVTMARSGDLKAQTYLGWAYIEGKYVQKNYDEGVKWLKLAGDCGSLEAEYRYSLVLIYNDDKEGFNELLNVCNKGYLPAIYDLGNCYFLGKAVEKNDAEALRFWKRAGEKGHFLAMLKYIKLEEAKVAPLKRLFFGIKYLWYSVGCAVVMARNPYDERVLGTL